jgi:hypothetical protein
MMFLQLLDQVIALWIDKLMDCRSVESFDWEPIDINQSAFYSNLVYKIALPIVQTLKIGWFLQIKFC